MILRHTLWLCALHFMILRNTLWFCALHNVVKSQPNSIKMWNQDQYIRRYDCKWVEQNVKSVQSAKSQLNQNVKKVQSAKMSNQPRKSKLGGGWCTAKASTPRISKSKLWMDWSQCQWLAKISKGFETIQRDSIVKANETIFTKYQISSVRMSKHAKIKTLQTIKF